MLHYYLTFSFHLKLALLTQLPTLNERKIPPHLKIKRATFYNGGFTQDLYMHICSISFKFLLWKDSMNALKSVARTQRVKVHNLLRHGRTSQKYLQRRQRNFKYLYIAGILVNFALPPILQPENSFLYVPSCMH